MNPTTLAHRRYVRSFAAAMVAYVVVLLVTVYLVKHLNIQGTMRYVLLLVPLIPVGLMVPVLLRYFRETDEFERRVLIESLAIAGGVTAAFAVTCGFLEIAGMPTLSAWWYWMVLMFSWGLTRCLMWRQYR